MLSGMFTTWRIGIVALLALAALCVGLTGCEKTVSRANYDKIVVGMTLDQVRDLMGPGERQESGGASRIAAGMLGSTPGVQKPVEDNRDVFFWRDTGKEISVVFIDSKVVDKNQAGL